MSDTIDMWFTWTIPISPPLFLHRICRVLERVTIRWIVSKEQGGYCCSGSMINLGGFEGKNIEKIISRLGFFLKWPWFPCYEHHETTIYAFYFRMVTFNIWSPTKKQSTLNLKKKIISCQRVWVLISRTIAYFWGHEVNGIFFLVFHVSWQ